MSKSESLATVNSAVSLASRIAARATAAPDDTAVVDGDVRLTFADLERQANRLASLLREAGAEPDRCVGLFLERSAEFVVAALAVLKTGAAYLPLDPATPADRAALILSDADSPLLLTHRGKTREWPQGPWRMIDLDDHETGSSEPVDIEPDPDSLAYLIYTSGSTGRPKGVEITHANLLNLIDWHHAAFDVNADDRASQVAGLGFDAAAWEIWPHLTAGASLHLADELTRRSPRTLRDWLVAQKITISFIPTVLAEQLLHTDWPSDTALRTLLTGADVLHRRPATGLPFVLVNNYGPTECTVVATSGAVAPEVAGTAPASNGSQSTLTPALSQGEREKLAGPPSIGRPISNATALILDDDLRPVRFGEAGELCLAGALVGRGYRNLPELTASRFVNYSPASGPPLRIYRTGDRARQLPNGEIAFLGRLDEQIKIRGYRIEPSEIVACLDLYSGIEASAVTTSASASGPLLVAYIVAAHGAELTASDLREFLAARLPDYMVPVQFVKIVSLPTTANGKLDKRALPSPCAANLLPNRAPVAGGPKHDDALQPKVAALVASLLGQSTVATEDNFFMIGGHSMLGVQLVARVRDLFGVKLTLRQLFNAPTIAALSAEVGRLVEKGNV